MAAPGYHAKLTKEQWEEIRTRVALGNESNRAIAKEYGISEMSIRRRFPSKEIASKETGHLLATAITPHQYEKAVKSYRKLDKQSQTVATTIMNELQEISSNLTSAAKLGSGTSKRMAELAHEVAQAIDPEHFNNDELAEMSRDVMRYTQISNEAAKTGLQLVAANKAMIEQSIKDICDPKETQDKLTNEQVVDVIKKLQNSI